MSLEYHIYAGVNAAVDFTTPVATTSSLTATVVLAASSTATYVVRAYDTVTALEDTSSDARVTVTTDSAGHDISGYPAPPHSLNVLPATGGTALVTWAYPLSGKATSFAVYLGTTAVNYAASVATVSFVPGTTFAATLTGLAGGTAYKVGVRATNALGQETNTTIVSFTARSSGPAAVVPVSAFVVS
jgi:hypothetical protein